jgi:hypothetical protein
MAIFRCPSDQRISGIHGRSGAWLDSLGVFCSYVSKDQSISPKTGGNGGTPFTDLCPADTIVSKFYGGSGALLDSVGIVCSDNKDFGKHGGSGGGYYEKVCSRGFTSFKVTSRLNVIESLSLQCFGEANIGGWSCPDGKVIRGIFGAAGSPSVGGSSVDSLGAFCGSIYVI